MTGIAYTAYNNSMAHVTDKKDQILLMLYGGALKFVRFARIGIEEKSPKIKGENISKIMAILTELDCALDREVGGPLAENLSRLYRYMMDRLTVANVDSDAASLDEVERLLSELMEGFEGAFKREEYAEVPVHLEVEEYVTPRRFCLAV
ncbi:MAG: flagellar export chaperone FliS, partial [Deltaproteobacteria bacterium]|jgi:flagellar protein FliS|nr:flagellar export chaperone FliS [Deltaproteobacteria bacterium]